MIQINAACVENAVEMLCSQSIISNVHLMLITRTQSWYVLDGKVWLIHGPNVYRCDDEDERQILMERIRGRMDEVYFNLMSAKQRHAANNQAEVTPDNTQRKLIETFEEGWVRGQRVVYETSDIKFSINEPKLAAQQDKPYPTTDREWEAGCAESKQYH